MRNTQEEIHSPNNTLAVRALVLLPQPPAASTLRRFFLSFLSLYLLSLFISSLSFSLSVLFASVPDTSLAARAPAIQAAAKKGSTRGEIARPGIGAPIRKTGYNVRLVDYSRSVIIRPQLVGLADDGRSFLFARAEYGAAVMIDSPPGYRFSPWKLVPPMLAHFSA